MIPSARQQSDSVHWTLQAPDGEFNVRIASGLIVGENAQGDFELAPTQQTALVRFEVDAGAVRIHLVSRDWTLSRNDRMVGDSVRSERTVELHLPNNVIRIVGGDSPAAEPDHVELTRRVSMKWLLPTSQPDAVEVPAVQAPDVAEAHILQPPPAPLEGTDDAPPRVPELEPQHEPATAIESVASPAQLPNARGRRTLGPLTAALIGVGGGIAIALLYQAFTTSTTQSVESRSSAVQTPRVSPSPQAEERPTRIEPTDHTAVAEGAIERSPAPKPAAAPAGVPATSVGSSTSDVSTTPLPLEPASGRAPRPTGKPEQVVAEAAKAPAPEQSAVVRAVESVSAEPAPSAKSSSTPAETAPLSRPVVAARPITEPGPREQVAEKTTLPTPAPSPSVVPVEHVAQPLVERHSTPEVARTVATSEAVPATKVSEGRSTATVVAEQKKVAKPDAAARARAAEETRARLLRAADVALAEGRLTTPAETSAYAFYKQVLALDPKSPEALNGLKSVRQGLINRTLAQLAANQLDNARSSLEGAAVAGVNPQLLADLTGEVDYRQRLSDAQAGRFGTLYPIDKLVPIRQEPPRMTRGMARDVEFVTVQFTVGTGGDVGDVEVLNAPPQRLEQAVRRAVSEWRFEPVLYNGRPLPVRSSVRFDFRNGHVVNVKSAELQTSDE